MLTVVVVVVVAVSHLHVQQNKMGSHQQSTKTTTAFIHSANCAPLFLPSLSSAPLFCPKLTLSEGISGRKTSARWGTCAGSQCDWPRRLERHTPTKWSWQLLALFSRCQGCRQSSKRFNAALESVRAAMVTTTTITTITITITIIVIIISDLN